MVSLGSNALAALKVALQHDRAASFDHASKLALRQTCTALKAAVNETLTKADLFRRPSAPLQTFLRRGWPDTAAVLRLRWSQLDGQNVLSLPRLQVLHVASDSFRDQFMHHASPDELRALASAADYCANLRLLWLEDIDARTGLHTLSTKRWVALETLRIDLLHFIGSAVPAMEGVDWDSSFPNLKELDIKIGIDIRRDGTVGNEHMKFPKSLVKAELQALKFFCWGDHDVYGRENQVHVGDAFLEELVTASWFQRLINLELHCIEAENVTTLLEAINASTSLERLVLHLRCPRFRVPLTCPSLKDLEVVSKEESEGRFSFFESAMLPNLERLSLSSGEISLGIADVTPTALPKLKALELHSPFWYESWHPLGYMVPQLTSLVLYSEFEDEYETGIQKDDVEYFLQGLRERCSQLFPGSSEQQDTLPLERLEIEYAPISPEAMRLLCSHFLTKCNALRELNLGIARTAADCITGATEQGQTWPCLEVLSLPVFTPNEALRLASKAHLFWRIYRLMAGINI